MPEVCPTLRAGGNRTGGDRPPGTDVDTCDSLIPEVAYALNAKGGAGRIDGESETFVTHSLRADGLDASEDGTGRGTPLVPVFTIKGAAIGREPENGPQYGEVLSDGSCYTLNRTEQHAVAFDAGDVAPTLRSMGHDGIHANGGGQVAVAHSLNGNSGVNQVDSTYVPTTMAVRRLTPKECSRLQGFPDDYCAIPYRGKPAADGPQYKAYGNAMAVNVIRWILNRVRKAHGAAL